MLTRITYLRSLLLITLIVYQSVASANDLGSNVLKHTNWSNGRAIINPDIGFTDFHSYNIKNDPYYSVPSYPETSVIYFRFYWDQIEPNEGEFHTGKIEEVFQQAKKLDKKVVLRFMTLADSYHYHSGIPCWVKNRIEFNNSYDSAQSCPISKSTVKSMYKTPEFRRLAENFLIEMGERFGNKEELLRVDVGMVGSWGEWHLSGWELGNPNLGSESIGLTNDDLKPYVDMVNNAFPNKQKTMLIGSIHEDMLSYATSIGMGWRADCLGDWGYGGWSHMKNGYPESIEHAKSFGPIYNQYPDPEFDQRWKTAPVDFEICWGSLKEWQSRLTYDQVVKSFEWALEHHASLINAKSSSIPDEYYSLVQDVLSKLGYQFELLGIDTESNMNRGQTYKVKSQWVNTGVAPSYLNYPIMYRLRDSSNNIVATFATDSDITKWMPAETLNTYPEIFHETDWIYIPADIDYGTYSLDVGLVKPGTHDAKIQLRNRYESPDRWYKAKTIYIYH
ncbi:DUF4832 domain-containing protein [Vibrio hannami]|uniref:DUF4832 domain-containing protein n=1 Tax=Vibrio hannami TaxID=2717094 RepID=UPI00240F2493|nr:DUF4832 domain-containing protein [Vibrio hannami]MDG3087105.1 DUF4832 domain-containing protein [Vibrio hannami]